MKKVFLAIFGTLAILSCNKENEEQNPPAFQGANIFSLFEFSDDSDFFVFCSLQTPSGLFQDFSLERGTASVQAASADETFVGELTFAGNSIPFVQNRFYDFRDRDVFNPKDITGKYHEISLSGSNFPSFSVTKYLPEQTPLEFSGIIDYRLPLDQDLLISWIPDLNLPDHGLAGIVVLGFPEDANGAALPILHKEFQVNDAGGSFNLSNSDISVFHDCEYMQIFFLRGYHEIEIIDGRKVDFQFIGHSHCNIYFQN